jgi:hypothetical protein
MTLEAVLLVPVLAASWGVYELQAFAERYVARKHAQD